MNFRPPYSLFCVGALLAISNSVWGIPNDGDEDYQKAVKQSAENKQPILLYVYDSA